MPRSASRRPREEEEEEDDGGLQASLHSRKEQARRLHIRTSCQSLCDLLPFVDGPLDTATTLELTVRYISYLTASLPPDLLSTVNETVVQNMKCSWKKSNTSSKKRRTICLKGARSLRSLRSKPSAQKTPDNAALWRSVSVDQTSTRHLIAKQPSRPPPPTPPPPGPVVMPILLDKWCVPRGQMLPLCQEQSSSCSSSFQCRENIWITPLPQAFSSPAFPSPALSSTSCPSPALHAMTSSTNSSQTAFQSEATVANHVVTLQILDATPPDPDATDPASGGQAMTTTVNLDAVWDPQDQTIVLSFSLPPAASSPPAQDPPPEGDRSPPGLAAVGSTAAPERWAPSFGAPTWQSGVSGSPITTGDKDKAGPHWLDLLCMPDAIFETNAAVGTSDQSHGTL